MHDGAQTTSSPKLHNLTVEAVEAPEQVLALGRLALAAQRDACGASRGRGQRLATD
eukprot:CAMPEP_0204194422 /NCGR_PEP_ID=MMETSP0361-20130328/62367_1 /ASSEMBLY_ACC=CAM_ASM_000343 /TAXON_ID=268821 /ORGANISM="Scrippsiella Hangoei, Strain SHTV-5" /LENGTH=55 /DNA_ID=CAMNT_0051155795 /DNA_START=59 /DNA_END=223 /DNA_ORIENTATION=+